MLVLVNTDNNIDSDADRVGRIEAEVQSALERFDGDLTRVEVHLRDESAGRDTVDDIRCLLEARPTGLNPVVVTHNAGSVADAVGGATHKLEALLTSALDRRDDMRGRETIRGRQQPLD